MLNQQRYPSLLWGFELSVSDALLLNKNPFLFYSPQLLAHLKKLSEALEVANDQEQPILFNKSALAVTSSFDDVSSIESVDLLSNPGRSEPGSDASWAICEHTESGEKALHMESIQDTEESEFKETKSILERLLGWKKLAFKMS